MNIVVCAVLVVGNWMKSKFYAYFLYLTAVGWSEGTVLIPKQYSQPPDIAPPSVIPHESGFGGLACWPLVTQVRGFKPGWSHRIFQGEKNPQHAFLRKGSKVVSPMS